MAVAGSSSCGAELTAADACPAASAVLQRFILSQEKGSGWPLETIEIDASKLKKAGWMRAIRKTSQQSRTMTCSKSPAIGR